MIDLAEAVPVTTGTYANRLARHASAFAYCPLQKIVNSLRAERRASPTPSKRYTPYNFTNIALIYRNSS